MPPHAARRAIGAALVAVAVALAAWSRPAAAAPAPTPTIDLAQEAELQFQLGVAAYEAHDLRAALEHLLASNRLVPNRNVSFNLGRVYEALGDPAGAWRYYDQFVTAEPSEERRAEGVAALARIAPSVARLRVTSEPPGATVYLERQDLGSRGLTPITLALSEGPHSVIVALDGFPVAERPVTLAVDATTDLAVQFGLPATPPPAPPWAGATVSSGDWPIVSVEPGRCLVLGTVEGTFAGRLDAPTPTPTGSALAGATPPVGLVLDVELRDSGLAEPAVRATLSPVNKRGLTLVDPSPLRSAVFERCRPEHPDAVARALAEAPSKVRLDAVRVLAEWAAWRGAGGVVDAAEACVKGDCAALAAALTR